MTPGTFLRLPRLTRVPAFSACVTLLPLLLQGCDSAITVVPLPVRSLTHLSVEPDSVSLAFGDSYVFAVSGMFSDGSSDSITVTWRTTDPGGAIDANGRYVAGQTEGRYEAVASEAGTGLADSARIVVFAPCAPPTSGSEVIWSAGMETGDLSEWTLPGPPTAGGGEFNSSGGDSWASQDVARSGAWSSKMVLANGAGGTRLFRWREAAEHREACYGAWFYFPQRYEPRLWWNIFQFKSERSASVSDPFWVLTVQNRDDGSMYVALDESKTGRSFAPEAVDLPVRSWVHLECYLRQSDKEEGRLKCWQDGQLLWDLKDITTHYAGSVNQWSVNNYSDSVSPTPTILYVDDASITVARPLDAPGPAR